MLSMLCDAVTFLAIPDKPYVCKPIQNCVWAVLMGQTKDVSQLVDICRQLKESRTVIADTRRNIVVNSSELGFNIIAYRSNSYASCSNSPKLSFNVVLYRCNSYASRSNSCCNSGTGALWACQTVTSWGYDLLRGMNSPHLIQTSPYVASCHTQLAAYCHNL